MAKAAKTTKAMTTMNETGLITNLATLQKVESAISNEMDGLSAVFEQIKIPIGGVTSFEFPGETPEQTETVKEFSAVILYHHPMRAYYKEKYTGGNNPPDCGSMDGATGMGEPGGVCEHCVYDQFGTGENGAKACKERRRLYLLLDGEIFPMILSLPTGSLRDFSRYLMRVLPKYQASNAVLTHFSLVKATNKGGIVYTKVAFRMERALTAEELAVIEPISERAKAISKTVGFEIETDGSTEKENTVCLDGQDSIRAVA
jgi:hypothetical protein